jgi:hypothetical protein
MAARHSAIIELGVDCEAKHSFWAGSPHTPKALWKMPACASVCVCPSTQVSSWGHHV